MNNRYSFEEVKDSAKLIDAWWTVKIIDPIAFRLTYLFANYTNFTPNLISLFALIFGLVSAYFFLKGDYLNLILGAIAMELSFVFDCVDGKIARLKKTGTQFGAYWDFLQDRLVQFVALFALIWGQYQLTGNTDFWILGTIYVFADALHRTSSFHMQNLVAKEAGRIPGKHTKEEIENILSQYTKTHSNWKAFIKRWLVKNRLATFPTTIETRVLLFFVSQQPSLLGLVLAVVALAFLTVIKNVMSLRHLYNISSIRKGIFLILTDRLGDFRISLKSTNYNYIIKT